MSAEIHARITGSRLVIVPAVKHYLHIEAAGTIAGLIVGFLADLRERVSAPEAVSPARGNLPPPTARGACPRR